ncbi:pyrroline-5-carboxylate reductase [Desulfosarcina ovata subsp. sediminis]|uniref:Pyrroline-5-carboxylate reductase n=1 Tax=Desulfosarcina ovata subsp. sediminis TaxID=885957 RepID=A0A5K7ZZA0_9BACT|nr:pyrroline-5-carboxylate reductase [Desulfosarcina ovata]BBO85484.1 pyrroline-5-carboxylate reductase [Desulfosarcina ovata subsp. sediminis]
MLSNKKIGMIGAGNMGNALIDGLIGSGATGPENIICSDANESQLEVVQNKFHVATTTDNIEVVNASDIIIYAVKPQIIASVLRETADHLDMSKLIISIAAGVPMAAIEAVLNKDLRLIRVMPNVAVAVREGATAVAAGGHASKDDVRLAMAIFDSVGKSIFLKENYLMDAITGLSGSGPAYIFLIVDALADAGVKVGLSRKDALFLASQTILGSAKLLLETGSHPGPLKDSVTSPGGTAIAGLHTLEKGGLRTTLINAVEAATNRSKELGEIVIKNFANGETKT